MEEERVDRSSESYEERHRRHQIRYEKSREKKRKKALIVSFIMSFVLIINIMTVGLYMGFFSTTASKRLSKSIDTYLDDAYAVVLQRVEALSIKNGLPSTIYEEVLTKDRMKITVESFVNDLSDMDFNTKIITEDLAETIMENVKVHLTSTGVKIDKTVSENIGSYVTQCINIYKNTLIFSHFRTVRQLKMYLFYAAIGVTIFCVTIIAICLILINRYTSHKRQMLRYIIYAVGSSWLLTLVPSLLIYKRVIPVYLKSMILECQFNLIMSYFYNAFHYLVTISHIILLIYFILVAAWYSIATNKGSHF